MPLIYEHPSVHPRRIPSRVLLALAGIFVVLGFGLSTVSSPGWTSAELGIDQWLSLHHIAVLDTVARTIAVVFGPPSALALLVALTVFAAFRWRSIAQAASLFIVAATAWLGSECMKVIVHRARPDITALAHPPISEHSLSYPSGHTVFATVFCISAVLVLGRSHRHWSVPCAVLVVALTAASRVYLGVHYPSDVAAGLVYALCAYVLAGASLRLVVARTAPGNRTTTPALRDQLVNGDQRVDEARSAELPWDIATKRRPAAHR